MTDPVTRTLLTQLALIRRFADEHVLPRIDEDTAFWEPSANCVTVRKVEDRLVAEWPDENAEVLPETTVAWLLWHIEWWWSNALAVCGGGTAMGPGDFVWSGSTARVGALADEWTRYLEDADPNSIVIGLMPEPTPLREVAGWVNFELTKNISEISQMATRRSNARSS